MTLKEKLYQAEEACAQEIEEIGEFIFQHPELGNEEFVSSQYLVDTLRKHGFTVTYPYLNIPTAFRAEYVCGKGKKIAFLAEYDALPGYGSDHNQNAHACGHNWISASCLGAAISLSKIADELDGTIVVIGTPAEETTGGKCELVDSGAFDDIDGAIQMHLGADTNIEYETLAMDSIEFNFTGKPAHAACFPEQGINALDAVQLMFAGINALRQHMKKEASVAGIITNGGQACNVVPDHASCRFYIRALHKAYLQELTEKVINCAKGACLMTGATLEYHNFENSYDDLVYDDNLRSLLKKNLKDLGVTNFVKNTGASGSSDIGNVSHACPTVYCEIDTGARPQQYVHTEGILPYVHGEKAKETLHIAVKAMAYTAIEFGLKK